MRKVRPTRPVQSGLLLATGQALVWSVLTWLLAGPPSALGLDQALNHRYGLGGFAQVLHQVDHVGQRAVCLPILAVVVIAVSFRHRSARPALLAMSAVLAVNGLTWVLKIWLGRGGPLDSPRLQNFFEGGQMYPSGHTGNIVAMYGLCAYLLIQYGGVSGRWRRALPWIVVALGVVMFWTSLLLRWHWCTDLVAGYLVGGVVLSVVVSIDRAVPFRSRRLVVLPPEQLPPPGSRAPDPAAARPSPAGQPVARRPTSGAGP